jgi:hypothetical protein
VRERRLARGVPLDPAGFEEVLEINRRVRPTSTGSRPIPSRR